MEKTEISQLQPSEVWKQFEAICRIPRPSKKEEKIRAYLLGFAQKNGLACKEDEAGNVLIKKRATAGMENLPIVVLQAHMDMVCEKNSDIEHDFDNDPILPYIDGDWVKAQGTTLGADDGIGMAAMLAILVSHEVKHGALECLFTVDEETGLTGANAIQEGFLGGKILINLDSEEEGFIYVGCAGGVDTIAEISLDREPTQPSDFAVNICVKGMQGGHSGGDIDKPRVNAIKMLNRFLWQENQKFAVRLTDYSGGKLRNAIPREASATIVFERPYREQIRVDFNIYVAEMEEVWKEVEPNMYLDLESEEIPSQAVTHADTSRLLDALYAVPHGVYAMSRTIPGMVETSTNLASIRMTGKGAEIQTLQRSDNESQKNDIAQMVAAAFQSIGGTTKQCEGYPGWSPNVNSQLLRLAVKAYDALYHKKPNVCSIHAGLECGLFLEKYPDMDMISFGPTLVGVHSPDEKIDIKSVQIWWKHLLWILEHIGG